MAMMTSAPLVSTSWLADHLADPRLRILDASWFLPGTARDPAAEFETGHIPGAVRFDIDEMSDRTSPLPHMLAAPSDFEKVAQGLGVNRNSIVVVYDSEGVFSAPRVWWNFRVMGHEESFVLDGGLPRWIAEGRPIETGRTAPTPGDFTSVFREGLVKDLSSVRDALGSGEAQIIDARSAERFAGAAPEPRAGLRGGHMPGALNLPWSKIVSEGRLLEPAPLAAAFRAAGVDLSKPIITTCGSGVSAAVLALGLARLGRFDVAVYDGSWSEWGARSDTAVVAGSAP